MPEARVGDRGAFLQTLRASRIADFRKRIFPYFRYVVQGGFGLFVAGALITGLAYYSKLLSDVPASLPVGWIGVLLLTVAAIRAPLRTYVNAADAVHLLPAEEAAEAAFVKPALKRAAIAGAMRCLATFLLFAPLYEKAPDTADVVSSHPLLALAALAAAIGAWNAWGGWRERRTAFARWRFALRVVRWLLTLLFVAAVLLKPLGWAVPFAAMGIAALWALWKLPAKHGMPWEKLAEDEEASNRAWLRFLGWFVDVPHAVTRPARRPWAAWTAKLLPRKREWAWHHLYLRAFVRGETFGAFWRWNALAGVVLLITTSRIGASVIYGVAALVGGMQLRELGRLRFAETAAVSPLPPEDRPRAAAFVVRYAGLTAAVALALCACRAFSSPAALPLGGTMLAAALVWYGWIGPTRATKNEADEDDE